MRRCAMTGRCRNEADQSRFAAAAPPWQSRRRVPKEGPQKVCAAASAQHTRIVCRWLLATGHRKALSRLGGGDIQDRPSPILQLDRVMVSRSMSFAVGLLAAGLCAYAALGDGE